MGGNQLLWTFFIVSIVSCQAAPANTGIPPLLSFKDGIFGVNFLGFHAAAGIGSNGRLHAEAGTPFGQRAAAGLNGNMQNGRLGGSLYAGATAGGNVKAAAGLGGEVIDGRTVGSLYSAASAGKASAGTSLDGDSNTGYVRNKVVNGGVLKQTLSNRVPVQVEEIQVPVKEVQISNDTPKEYPPIQAISNDTPKEYAPIQEIPKEAPISNDVEHGDVAVKKVTHIRGHPVTKYDQFLNHQIYVEQDQQKNRVQAVQTPVVITKRIQIEALPPPPPPPHHHHHHPPPPPPPPPHHQIGDDSPANFGSLFLQSFLGGGTGEVAVQRFPKSPDSETTVTTTVHKSPTFFEDIFNIPISTLGAVSKFLSNSAGSVQKTVSVQQSSQQ